MGKTFKDRADNRRQNREERLARQKVREERRRLEEAELPDPNELDLEDEWEEYADEWDY